MRKSRFTEAQIIGMVEEHEAGLPTADMCRKHGLNQGTFNKFKSQYCGMEVSGPSTFYVTLCGSHPEVFERGGFVQLAAST